MKTLLFLFISCISFAQSTNRFYYQLDYKPDPTENKKSHDTFILDIGKSTEKFYNAEYLKNDSIEKSRSFKDDIFSYPDYPLRIVRKKNSPVFSSYSVLAPQYYVSQSTAAQSWTILPQTKIIAPYKVQKATTNFGGRTWTAWFSSDIPISSGPYKFHGLPGLILEVYDSAENYHFLFLGNKKVPDYDTKNFIETEHGQQPVAISSKDKAKLMINYFLNPLKEYGDGGLIVENERGEKVKADTREITRQIQSGLIKQNNPIELEEKINYPHTK